MQRSWALAGLLLTVALAGCFGADADPDPDDLDDDPTDPAAGQGNGSPTPGGAPGPGNGTPPPAPSSRVWEWPALTDATIRPGVQMIADGSQCTSNFVFLDPSNTTVFLGFAAHCVAEGGSTNTNGCDPANDPLPLGTPVQVEGASKPAVLVYSSWMAMQALNETDPDACAYNDFALVAIHPDDAHKVHPAMLVFGGPTETAPAGAASMGTKVLTFGNSGLRPGPNDLDAREGYSLGPGGKGWTITVYTATPGVPGDSGSAVILGDGRALGILSTVAILPFSGSNQISSLHQALAYAEEEVGLVLVLGTWDLTYEGILP